MSKNGTTTSIQSTTSSGYSASVTPLIEMLKANIQFIITIISIVSFFTYYKYTIDGMEKVQAAQRVDIDQLQDNYMLIGLQLTKIQTTLDESIKPDVNTIKKDVKDLQAKQ
jgi:hypothetical protein